MPQGDRTGPMGQGPMTGRAMGFCTGYDSPGFTKGFGEGMGRAKGRGFGFGRGHGFHGGWGFGRSHNLGLPSAGYSGSPRSEPLSKADEIKMLKAQVHTIKRSQSDIEKRLRELENEERDI